MRLVDADAFRMEILVSANPENYGSGYDDYDDGCISASENLLGILDTFPTVDAAPVVHAHWVRQPQINHEERFRCSRCSQEVRHCEMNSRVYEYYRYCSSCGAKMDEEVPKP